MHAGVRVLEGGRVRLGELAAGDVAQHEEEVRVDVVHAARVDIEDVVRLRGLALAHQLLVPAEQGLAQPPPQHGTQRGARGVQLGIDAGAQLEVTKRPGGGDRLVIVGHVRD